MPLMESRAMPLEPRSGRGRTALHPAAGCSRIKPFYPTGYGSQFFIGLAAESPGNLRRSGSAMMPRTGSSSVRRRLDYDDALFQKSSSYTVDFDHII